jgi:hypothetical protein
VLPPSGPLVGTWVYFGDGTPNDNPLLEAQVSAYLTNLRMLGLTKMVLENARTHAGCAGSSSDFRWLPEMPSKLGTLLAAALPAGALWADVELFNCCVNEFGFSGGDYHPASVARLNQQLWGARHASARLSWLVQEDMAGPPFALAYPESTRLREAYLGLYGLGGHAVKAQSYTWTTPPAAQYPDPGNAKLFDTVTGDPLDYQNPAWVGVMAPAEVVVELGAPTALRWAAVHLLRDKAPSIVLPTSLTLACDPTGSAGFSALGSWPLALSGDANGEYVFSNAAPLAATCARLRIHLDGSAWIFLSEVELTGP